MPKQTTNSRVAALVYLNDGVTLAEAKKLLDEFARRYRVRSFDPKSPSAVGHTHIEEYDPDFGGPVWYIP